MGTQQSVASENNQPRLDELFVRSIRALAPLHATILKIESESRLLAGADVEPKDLIELRQELISWQLAEGRRGFSGSSGELGGPVR
jgi:hypothetical protein